MEKHCIIEGCNEPRYGGSRYCHRHYLDRKAAQRKVRKDAGLNYRTLYTKECQICGASYNVTAKHGSKYCHDCRSKIANFAPANVKGGSEYVYSKNEYKTSTLEHRCIATKVIGRKLTSADIVHHIDGNTKNNSLENLLFLSNKKHIKLHQWLNEQLYIRGYKEKLTMKESWDKYCKFYTDKWIFNNKDECIILNEVTDAEEKVKTSLGEYFVREKSSKKIKSTCSIKNSNKHIKKEKVENPKRYCVFCGNELKNRQITFCSYECQRNFNGRNVPSKEELIKIIKSKTSLLQVAKHYNVSDNNARKWLKKYNINICDFGYRKLK
jgi:predicted nucleic acid-binding Zn ribbon protein